MEFWDHPEKSTYLRPWISNFQDNLRSLSKSYTQKSEHFMRDGSSAYALNMCKMIKNSEKNFKLQIIHEKYIVIKYNYSFILSVFI